MSKSYLLNKFSGSSSSKPSGSSSTKGYKNYDDDEEEEQSSLTTSSSSSTESETQIGQTKVPKWQGKNTQETGTTKNTTQETTTFTEDNLPSYRDILGRLTEVYEENPEEGVNYANQFAERMSDPGSAYYRTYAQPTSQAVSKLTGYGIDTSTLDDNFFAQNESWIRNNLIYNGTSTSPTKPGKKASDAENIAYWLYQYYDDEGTTQKAEEEYKTAMDEARYWAWRSDRNMSDEEIIAKVREDFSKKYPTLAKMEDKGTLAPLSLNRAVDFSDDALYGAIWMGRNGEFDGTIEQAMAYSALGRGFQYETNEEIAQKLDPKSDKFDGGYSLGCTNLDDAAFYFRVSGFTKEWIDEHNDLMLTGSDKDKEMYGKVLAAYDNQTKAEEELDKLISFVESKVNYKENAEDILSLIDWKKYPTLAAMDKSIGQNGNIATGDLVALTQGLSYTYNGLSDYVTSLMDYKNQKQTCDAYITSMSGALTNTIQTMAQKEAESEAEQQALADKTMSHPEYRPSEQAIEIAKERDRKITESAEMTADIDTPAEKAVNTNQRSSMYTQTLDVLNLMKDSDDKPVYALAPFISNMTTQGYSQAVLTGFDTVQAYEQNSKRIDELQTTKDELGEKLGNLVYAGKQYKDEETVPVTINGKTYDLNIAWNWDGVGEYNEETGEMDRTGKYIAGNLYEHGTQDAAQGDYTAEEYQQAVQAALDEANLGRASWEEAQGVELTDEIRADIEAYWKASEDLDAAKLTQQDNEEAYQTAKKNIDDAKLTQEHRIELFKEAGLDTTAMEQSAVVTDFFLDFTKYDPTEWGSYNFYHSLSEMMISGDASAEEVFKTAETGDAEIQQAIDVARTMLEYADENGISLPDNVRNNVERYISSLETQHQDFEYMSLIGNEDFEPGAAEGRRIADEMSEIDFSIFDAELLSGKSYKEILETQPSWEILSEEQRENLLNIANRIDNIRESAEVSGGNISTTDGMEEIQETYNAYLAELKIEDRMFGAAPFNVPMGEIMTDYELDTYYYLLGTQGFEAAQEYSDHIALDNGVLNSRLREQTEEKARGLADQGFWGSRAADALSMLLSPVAAAQSFAYSLRYGIQKLSGENVEWNPNSADLSANIYKKAAREEIQNQIKERYKDNPVLQKVMSGLQEIISNRGDSIVNGLVFGNFFDGIANQYLQEFLSAVPMGVAAATDAVSEAKEKGASDTQLLGIYATTLLFEAGTEAVSLDNIRESLDLGKELTVDGLKDWAKEWLTKSGISEMIGETITEAVEQAADTYFLGENSDYAKAVEQYKADGMSEDAAKQQASLDQVGNLLHTALISYLSPGMDIASYAAGRYSGYKSEARYHQEHGNNVSVMDVYKEYKQRKSGEQPSQTQAQTAEIEANNSAPDIEGTYGQENAIPESPTAPENPVEVTIPETSKPKYDTAAQALTLDIEILESANNGDPSVQTASIAAVLNTGRTDESFDVSNAAAVNMSELFGDVTPSEGIQNLMLGAHVTDVDVDMVKHAIETAALSKNSDAYKIMQTEEYQNADPGERAEMLADTVDNDMNNQVVVNDISKAVYENRVAQAENKVLDMPEVKQAYGKAYDAQGKLLAAQDATEQAQTQLDGYESELDAKRDALRTAGDELSSDASDAARVDMVSHAIADLQKTSEVVEEYKQHLTKMQKAETEAQELADRTLEEYANTKRTFAERLVNEENQQRSETKAQQDAQAAVDQAKAQQQAEQEAAQAQAQEETDNADYADREAFVDKIAAENPDMTEEDKQTVRDMYDQEVAARNESNPVTEPARDENGILTTQAKKNRDKFVQGVSKKFGIQVDFMDTSEGGTKVKANGYYDAANNRIVLDQNATMDEAMYAVLGHELTHVAEKSETYTSLANSILRIAYGDDADYEAAVNNLNRNNGKPTTKLEADIVYLKNNVYDKQLGKNHTYEEIAQEVVADKMGALLNPNSEEERQDLVNRLVADDPSVAQRILNSIKSFIKKTVGMKGAWLSSSQKTVDMLETALKEAQGTQKTGTNANTVVTERTEAKSNNVPSYKVTQGWDANRPTIKFDSVPDQYVTNALYEIGMVQGKDASTWKTSKGNKVSEAKINYTIKNAVKTVEVANNIETSESVPATQVKYSLPNDTQENELLDAYTNLHQTAVDLANKYREITQGEEIKAWGKRIENTPSEEMDSVLAEYKDWEDSVGLPETVSAMKEADQKSKAALKALEDYIEQRDVGIEQEKISESGMSEPDWRRSEAANYFGYTSNVSEAGYLLPDGKMLNFSGEKGKHRGYRSQDHREIGTIYASSEMQGSTAMNTFMNDGNIRVMPESPGVDISVTTEPTSEQYSAIRKMARQYADDEYFSVDFSGEDGRNVGNIEYEGKIYPEKVVNDIKTYFATGEVPQQSELAQFRYSLPSDESYLTAVNNGDTETAQQMVDEAAKEAGYDVEYAVWRGDSEQYNELEPGLNGGNLGTGLYFTPDRAYAEKFATRNSPVRKFYLKTSNTFDYDTFTQEFNEYAMSWLEENDMEPRMDVDEYTWSTIWDDFISENDYDSVKARGVGGLSQGAREISVQDSWQAKLADPVTYDDNGNVIPLSERFNDQKDDIRYSLPSDDILRQQIRDYMANGGSLAQTQTTPSNHNTGIRQWGNQGAQQSDELDAQAKQYVLNSEYAKDTNEAELNRAIDWIRSNKQYADDDGFRTSLDKVTSKRFNYLTKDGQARMVAVMALAVAKGDTEAQVQLADAYNQQGTDLGQALQARKLFRLMTPTGRVATLQKMLSNVQEQTGNENIRLSDWIYQAAAEATEEGEFNQIRKAAAAELADQIPGNWKDKLRGVRMLSMLGNPRTHIRNIVGNALFVPAVSLKNEIGALAEVITGQTERTKTLKLVLPKEIREFAKQDADFMKDELTGEAKYNEGNLVQREQKPFKGFMQSLIDFNGNALEAEDWFFLKGHYQRALGGWIDANGYTVDQLKNNTALLDKGRAYAINEAQKATYRDYNGLADKLNQMSRDPQTTGQKILGFATDAVLPFKKTPANILKRGIEYSPAGLVRGLKNAMLDVRSGKITASEAIDRICSGLAGTAVMAMGAFLAQSGIVTCGLGDDDDKNEKEQGNQKYSIKLNLFGEDVTYTMDWAAPMSMPFFVGAAIQNQVSKEGSVDINELVNAMSNIAEPVFNLSMLDGVNTLFKTSQNDDTDAMTQIGAKVLANYASSYVPSLLGAVSRTIDDKRRSTYVESGQGKGVTGTFRYAWEQVENKIPGLSQTNIATRDVFGREETDSLAERIVENFISPGYISHYKDDPILNEMDRLYNANVTDSEKMVPSDPPKSFKYNNEQYTLNAEQWDTFKTVRGQTAYNMLNELIASADYQSATDAAQVQMFENVWDYATKVGKAAVVPNFNIGDEQTVESIIRSGNVASYNSGMLTSLEAGDYLGYTTMVEGLHQQGVEDSDIKAKIRDTYREKYKEAYRIGDKVRMSEIEQILDMSDFDFTDLISDWEEAVDKKNRK